MNAGPQQHPAAQPVAVKQRSIKDDLMSDQFRTQMAMALPDHVKPDRMLRVILTSLRKNAELMQCTPESFFASVLTLAQLGLEPDDPRGQAHLVAFNCKVRGRNGQPDRWQKECSVIIGYRGYIDLSRRTGEVSNIRAEVVYEKDHFLYETGLTTRLEHRPTEDADPGAVRAAYAIATMKDGTLVEKVLWRRDIERARMASREGSKGSGPWRDWYPEMAAKTAVRRLMKTLPSSPNIALANMVDESRAIPLKLDGKNLTLDIDAAAAALEEAPEVELETRPVADRMAAKAAAGKDKQTDAPAATAEADAFDDMAAGKEDLFPEGH